ncbi:MAG TPA: hypothetical protein VK901_16390 [Nitrospiraceae bacterium]|nr:hypothetical protein [Nitrospiraceae bacterium]
MMIALISGVTILCFGAMQTLGKSDWNNHIPTEEFDDYYVGNNFRDFAAARS